MMACFWLHHARIWLSAAYYSASPERSCTFPLRSARSIRLCAGDAGRSFPFMPTRTWSHPWSHEATA